MQKRYHLLFVLALLVLATVLVASLACASTEPTATPAAPAQPAAPVAPTAAAQPTATLVPGAPTPASTTAAPTPTRVLPTPTAVSASNQPVYGGIMRMAANLDNKTMDPHIDGETYGRPVTYALFNTIVGYDPSFNIIPELAQSWEVSSNGMAVTFHLVPGIKFSDGSPLDASAVKWSLERVMNQETGSPHRSNLNPVSKIDVVDATTFVVNLKAPYRPLMAVFGDRPGFVVPKTAPIPGGQYGAGAATSFAVNPVGSGPFKVKEWKPGGDITLTKRGDYWQKGKPYLDGIVLQFVPEESSQLAMLRTGETDLIDLQPEALTLVRNNPSIKIVPHESGRWAGIGPLSVDVPPWNNRALRQALAYGIDRQAYVDVSLKGNGRVAYTSEGGFSWTKDPNLKPVYSDKTIAKQKMVEAGFPNGVSVPAYCDSTTQGIQDCELYQSSLKEIGLNLEIVPTLTRDFTTKQTSRQITSRFITSWRPRADPDGRLRILFYSTGGQSALSGYKNPEVDKLMDEAATMFDTVKAKQVYNQIETLIIQDAPFVITAYYNSYAGLNTKLQNFAWIPDFQFRLRDLWFSK